MVVSALVAEASSRLLNLTCGPDDDHVEFLEEQSRLILELSELGGDGNMCARRPQWVAVTTDSPPTHARARALLRQDDIVAVAGACTFTSTNECRARNVKAVSEWEEAMSSRLLNLTCGPNDDHAAFLEEQSRLILDLRVASDSSDNNNGHGLGSGEMYRTKKDMDRRAKSFAVPDEQKSPTPRRQHRHHSQSEGGGNGEHWDASAEVEDGKSDSKSENGDDRDEPASNAFALVFYVRLINNVAYPTAASSGHSCIILFQLQ